MRINKKTFVGEVVSDNADKTATVKVKHLKKHPIYKKRLTFHKKYAAHDPKNMCKVGDIVKIVECRPISATKHFYVKEIKSQG